VNSQLVLDIPEPPTDPAVAKNSGAIVQQFHIDKPGKVGTGLNQQWQLQRSSSGGYQIVNVNSELVLGTSFAPSPSPWVAQGPKAAQTPSQEWRMIPPKTVNYPSATFAIINADSGHVLDVPHSSTNGGQQVQTYPENGGTNQQWQFVAPKGHSLPSIAVDVNNVDPQGSSWTVPLTGTGFGTDAGQKLAASIMGDPSQPATVVALLGGEQFITVAFAAALRLASQPRLQRAARNEVSGARSCLMYFSAVSWPYPATCRARP
jgi:hypothetical protein